MQGVSRCCRVTRWYRSLLSGKTKAQKPILGARVTARQNNGEKINEPQLVSKGCGVFPRAEATPSRSCRYNSGCHPFSAVNRCFVDPLCLLFLAKLYLRSFLCPDSYLVENECRHDCQDTIRLRNSTWDLTPIGMKSTETKSRYKTSMTLRNIPLGSNKGTEEEEASHTQSRRTI